MYRWIIFLLFFFCSLEGVNFPKVLHLTFHKGCEKEIKAISKLLSLDVTTWFIPELPPKFFDGESAGNSLYNMDHIKAERVWNLHHHYFNSFDFILISDTAPLARIFLQNNFSKQLIIWICNRFDYCDIESLDCDFPDKEFYQLFRNAAEKSNITILAFTPFEHYYAKKMGVNTGSLVIGPTGLYEELNEVKSIIPASVNKPETFFLPPYHNEQIYINLSDILFELGIINYCGKYAGPQDLKDFQAIIHLPYSWCTFSFFENISNGLIYFIPSRDFFIELAKQRNYFHPNLEMFLMNNLFDLNEWYNPEKKEVIQYFDSWEDLQQKIQMIDYEKMREKVRVFSRNHQEEMLRRWREVFND